jgi:Zn-dependent protease with chaperone function
VLTKNGQTSTLQRMPMKTRTATRQKQSKKAAFNTQNLPVVKRYQKYFSPIPSQQWRQNDITHYEELSPLKWVPSETTYGIGAQ